MVSPGELNNTPLVSVGVPVRNGAAYIEEALSLLVNQTYRNIEIIISNNNSDDETADIVARFKNTDLRIKVYSQSRTLTAAENFLFVLEKATGPFFMWAADDDRRSLNYIEMLQKTITEHPESSLVFGDVAEFSRHSSWENNECISYPFQCDASDSTYTRLGKYIKFNCLHIYGLMKTEMIMGYHWPELDNGPDVPILVYLSMRGDFIKSEGGVFYYHTPIRSKTLKERSLANSLRELRPFPELRLSWHAAIAARNGSRSASKTVRLLPVFLFLYFHRHWRWIKPKLFDMSPEFAVHLYRKYKYPNSNVSTK